MSYKVVVPCVLARDQDGHVHHKYQDAVINWLSKEQAKHFLDEGLVEEIGGSTKAAESEPESADDAKPNRVAPKADWVAFAVDYHGIAHDEAEAMTKQDLVDAFG